MSKTDDGHRPDEKQRVFTEEAKQRQVSHWDRDYLPTEELERLMDDSDNKDPGDPAS